MISIIIYIAWEIKFFCCVCVRASLLGCSFILSIFSFLASFSIMCVFAASIVEMKQYSSNPCTGYVIVPPGHYMGDYEFPIPPCSYYSKLKMFACL